jgi:phosphoglycolate phosphatase
MQANTTVLWDWNGTLLNDVALCYDLLNQLLTEHGYAPVEGGIEAYRRLFRFPVQAYYQDAGFDFSRHSFSQLAQRYMELYLPQCLTCSLQPNAQRVLQQLRAQGVRQIILSASQANHLAQQVEHFGLTASFDKLLGLGDIYAKSKVDIGRQWLQQSGADPRCITMIGDSVHDYEVAQALNVHCVLFDGGHQTHAALAATDAPVIHQLDELLPLLAEQK